MSVRLEADPKKWHHDLRSHSEVSLSNSPLEAVMVTTVRVTVGFVSAVNLADLDPAATVTLLGTVTSAVLFWRNGPPPLPWGRPVEYDRSSR